MSNKVAKIMRVIIVKAVIFPLRLRSIFEIVISNTRVATMQSKTIAKRFA